jgi:anti-anti-sigma factor
MKSSIKFEVSYDLLQLSGDVNLHYSPQLRNDIMSLLKNRKPLLIDLAQVSYIDSAAIASLVEGLQIAKLGKLSYGLLNINRAVMQTLALARLDKIFSLYTNAAQFQNQLYTEPK